MRRETWYRLLPGAVILEGVIFAIGLWLVFPLQETATATPAIAVKVTFLLVILGGIVYIGHFSQFATLESDEVRQIYAIVLIGFGSLFIFALTDILGGFLEIPVFTRALAADGMLIVGTVILFAGIKGWSDHREAREDDLTDARDELARQTERLEAQRDNLKVLNQVLRHDIRNDLQLMLTYGEMLEDHVDDDGEEYVETVLENTRSAIDLTTTAREIAETMLHAEADRTEVDLGSVLQSQIDEARQSHDDALFRLEGSVPQLSVAADPMLASVVRNLLTNAVVHNDSDRPEVTVSVDTTDDSARVRIADNGPGVPPHQQDVIFGEGEQGMNSEGTGLGLFLVRTLVESYDGTVSVANRTDATPDDEAVEHVTGAVFEVELPLATAATQE